MMHITSPNTNGTAEIVHEPERMRWVAEAGSDIVGALTYQLVGERYVLVTTFVDEIRRLGKTATGIRPFVCDFMGNHPDYADLIDPVRPGRGAYGAVRDPAPPSPTVAQDAGVTAVQMVRLLVFGSVVKRGPISRDEVVAGWAGSAVAADRRGARCRVGCGHHLH